MSIRGGGGRTGRTEDTPFESEEGERVGGVYWGEEEGEGEEMWSRRAAGGEGRDDQHVSGGFMEAAREDEPVD